MYTQDKRRIMRRYDIIETNKKKALTQTIGMSIGLGILTLFCGGVGTGMMIAAFTETNGFLVLLLVLLFGGLLFWAIPVTVAMFMRRELISGIAFLKGNYIFEIDHAAYSVPKTYHGRNGGSSYTLYVTQFEKYGKVELGKPPLMGQEFYVLATLTKKPRIIDVYPLDKYEIVER